MRQRAILFTAFCLMLPAGGLADTLEDNLSAFTGDTAEGYLKPLQQAFGQALNSNFFTTAAISKVGFHARVELKAMSIFFADGDKTFAATPPEDFGSTQAVEAPTVVGSTRSVSAPGPGGTAYVFPGGFDLSSMTVAVPQITVGGIAGTELTGRWFSVNTGDAEIGDVSFLGIGVRHSISQYLPTFPLDVAGAVYYQTFDLGDDLVDAKMVSVGIQGSKSLGIVTPYGGIALDSTSMSVDYTADTGDGEEPISLDFESEKTLHLVVGAAMGLGLVRLNAGADLGQMAGVSAGIGFGF